MKVFRITGWDKNYENNRTRTMDEMRWVPIPNKHDGDGYTEMVDGADGASILGAWLGIVQVASKCHPRGTLVRQNGTAHTAETIARQTRLPVKAIEKALTKASSTAVLWIEVIEIETAAPACQAGVTEVSGGCGQMTIEGKGIEEKGTEGNGKAALALLLLSYLNEKAGRKFEECPENLNFIKGRLEDCQADVDGCKQMIDRQCALWKGDEKMDAYLRPSTLFNKSKFRSYYDDRSRPVQPKLLPHNPRNNGVTNDLQKQSELIAAAVKKQQEARMK